MLYIYGKAGTGKTEVALHVCEHFNGRLQAGAGTSKAASKFNGPTVHAMFGWSHNQHSQAVVRSSESTKLARLRVFYEETEVFVIDEVNAMSALFQTGWTSGTPVNKTLLSDCLFQKHATTLVGIMLWWWQVWLHCHQVSTILPRMSCVWLKVV